MKGFDKKSVFVTIYLVGLLIVAFGYFFLETHPPIKSALSLQLLNPKKHKSEAVNLQWCMEIIVF